MTTDPIVLAVMSKLSNRSQVGMLKYGKALDRPDYTTLQWLEHAQEELLDAANYFEVLIRRLKLENDMNNRQTLRHD